ncbi:histidine kinase [Aquirufa sp. HETE-83D]|uniref:Histidine kinase n=1 Tax=Aquirufa esocilacus TaxID=3096513 RepID=A0ABW6DK89_9BACT
MTSFTIINIPFFYLNTEILLPKLLRAKGVIIYLLTLIGAIVFMLWIHEELFRWAYSNFFPGNHSGGGARRGALMRMIFQLLFYAAIGTSYRLISDRMKEDEQVKEQENERLKSELSFLRSQISPHFMFNVLNSVVSLSRRKPEMVEQVVVKLSELMRYMIYETNDSIVPISKELVYLESYIDLQKIRFGDDIHIDFKHELGPISSHIEPMLLIPFVENAFKHGVGFIENPTIEIELKDSATELYFKVANKKGASINEIKDESSGIGLANVKRRLELLYPTNHRLEVLDSGSDFTISLTIQHV